MSVAVPPYCMDERGGSSHSGRSRVGEPAAFISRLFLFCVGRCQWCCGQWGWCSTKVVLDGVL